MQLHMTVCRHKRASGTEQCYDCVTYPRHDELSSQILHLSFHLTADVELVAVQGDPLQVGQQVLLAR